jgi:hypothetical protein
MNNKISATEYLLNATKELRDLYDVAQPNDIVDVGVCLPFQSLPHAKIKRYRVLDKKMHSEWSYSMFLQCIETNNVGYFWIWPKTRGYQRIVSISVV